MTLEYTQATEHVALRPQIHGIRRWMSEGQRSLIWSPEWDRTTDKAAPLPTTAGTTPPGVRGSGASATSRIASGALVLAASLARFVHDDPNELGQGGAKAIPNPASKEFARRVVEPRAYRLGSGGREGREGQPGVE